VRAGSLIAGELDHIGITSKTHPGLFKANSGLSDFDAIPASEQPIFAERTQTHDEGGIEGGEYIAVESIMDAIRDEVAGKPWRTSEEQTQINEFEGPVTDFISELEQRGIDLDNLSNEEVKTALNQEFVEEEYFQSQRLNLGENEFLYGSHPDHVQKVRQYYKSLRDGKGVPNKDLNQTVQFSKIGENKTLHKADRVKLKLISKLEEIVADAKRDGDPQPPKDEKEKENVKWYHPMVTQVSIDGNAIYVHFFVREDNRGHFQYDLNYKRRRTSRPNKGAASVSLRDTSRKKSFSQSVQNHDDNVNLILKQNENQNSDRPYNGFFDGDDLIMDQGEEMARGSIQFSDNKTLISLFKDADLSTFLHESGHFFLNVIEDVAAGDDAPQQLRDDLQTIRDWMGVAPGEKITTEHHEKFARGFESYLREGKAPSEALQEAFASFKAWLVRLYESALDLDVEINSEMRGVFDRMLATEQEIKAAEQQHQFTPLFEAVGAENMSQTEYQDYIKAARNVSEASKEDLLKAAMVELGREKTRWWKDEEAKIKKEVKEQVYQDPAQQAAHFLRTGKFLVEPDREISVQHDADLGMFSVVDSAGRVYAEAIPFEGKASELAQILKGVGGTARLDKKAILESHSPEALGYMKGMYRKEGGFHPDTVAPWFGFDSGEKMVRALWNVRKKETLIKEESQRIMREKHGDILNDGSIEEEAVQVVYSNKRGELIAKELAMLNKQTGGPELSARAVQEKARQIIAAKKSQFATRPHIYSAAARRSGSAAIHAMARGDIAEAERQTRKRLLNHYLFIESKKAKDEVNKMVDYFSGFNRPGTRQSVAQNYIDQIDKLLERFSFKKSLSGAKALKRESFTAWIQKERDAGRDPVIDPALEQEAFKKHYKVMTLDELRGLKDAVTNIEHLGRLKQKLLNDKEQRDFDAAVESVVGRVYSNVKLKPSNDQLKARGWEEKKKWFATAHANHTKMEFLFRQLDGGEDVGEVWNTLFKPLADAEVNEQKRMREIQDRLNEIWSVYSRKERKDMSTKLTLVPEAHGFSFSKAEMMAVALNMGNEENLFALMHGRSWSERQVGKIVEHLDDRDWQVVQDIWNLIDTLWPDIKKLQRDLTGLTPEKVVAREFTTPTGKVMQGGYYPLKADPASSVTARRRKEKEDGNALFETTYIKPVTKKGHTIERVGFGGQQVHLDLGVLTEHLNNAVHDLTHRRAVLDVNRLTEDARVQEALSSTVGPEMYDQIRPWLQSIAKAPIQPAHSMERVLGRLRRGGTIVSMGYKITTMVAQVTGILTTVNKLGAKTTLEGYKDFFKTPADGQRTKLQFVMDRSELMRNRAKTFDRDVNDTMKSLTEPTRLQDIQRFAFSMTGMMDMTVSVPTWLAAYNKGMNDYNGNEEKAIDFADMIVRTTQSAGGAKDLAAIQRGTEAWRLFVMFYSYFNGLYNQQSDEVRNLVEKKDVPRFLAAVAYLWLGQSLLAELIAQRGPDDDEDWGEWALKNAALFPLQSVAFVRDIASGISGDYGYGMSPVAGGIESGIRAVKDISDGEVGKPFVKNTMMAAGYWWGLPSRQAWITGEAFWDAATGEEIGLKDPFFPRRK
ncbi:MAG: hypothetical protein HQL70_12050, partial [Magnetococcales bacterium]|nr:hypothetical protein [Magnetococcales bacterium]